MNKLLKRMRLRVNLSQEEVAQAVGVQQSTISRIESECSSTSYKLLLKIYLFLRQKNHNKNDFKLTFSNRNIYEFLSILVEDPITHDLIIKNPIETAHRVQEFLSHN